MPPDDSIRAIKRRLRAKYLGREGIHALGVYRAHNALRVYAHSPLSLALLQELRADADPFAIETVTEQAPELL